MIASDKAAAAEASLEASIAAFGGLPDGFVADDGDLLRVGSGYRFASFNHVLRSRLDVGSADRRIDEVIGAFGSAGMGLTWWVMPTSQPSDLGRRLVAAGLTEAEPEFAMTVELDEESGPQPSGPVADALGARTAAGVSAGPVLDRESLSDWISVMSASYGWPDPGKRGVVLQLYEAITAVDASGPAAPPDDRLRSDHFLVRLDGQAVACSTLSHTEARGWVTNVGTVPGARRRGLGTLATALGLEAAAQLGCKTVSLAASVMGREMYRRLGFRDVCTLERYVTRGY